MFVVEEFGVIEIRPFDLGGGPLRDGKQFLDGSLASMALEAFVAFPQGFRDNISHRLAGGFGNGLSEAMGFRVFDVEACENSFFLYIHLLFFILVPFVNLGKFYLGETSAPRPALAGLLNVGFLYIIVSGFYRRNEHAATENIAHTDRGADLSQAG